MSVILAAAITAIFGLLGVLFTQSQAEKRAEKRETEAARREDARDAISRGREVKDRWFEDRKTAYVATLVAAREALDHVKLMLDYVEILGADGLRGKNERDRWDKLVRLRERAGDLELVGSNAALNVLSKFILEIQSLTSESTEAVLKKVYSNATTFFVKFRETSRKDLGIDGEGNV